RLRWRAARRVTHPPVGLRRPDRALGADRDLRHPAGRPSVTSLGFGGTRSVRERRAPAPGRSDPMPEQTEGQIVIEAAAADGMDGLIDFEAYAEWADVKSATILERGEGGLGTKVAFEVDVPVLGRASYTLAYRYAPGDGGLSWVSTEARGAVSNITGEYLLS